MARESIVSGDTAGGTRRAATHYGRRVEEGQHVAEYNNAKGTYTQETTFRYDQLPVATLDELHQRIPVGARVLSVTIAVIETFTATTATAITVGTVQPDGTGGDPDGFVDATAGAIANWSAGAFLDGAGALVGASVGLSNAVQLKVTPDVDDLLTGEARITVEYEKPRDSQQQMNG